MKQIFILLFAFFTNQLSAYDSFTILDKDTSVLFLQTPTVFRGNIEVDEAHNAFMHNKFQQLPTQAKSLGFSDTTYWIGFIISNIDNERLYLNLKDPLLEHIEYFAYQNHKLISSSKTSKFRLCRKSLPTLYLVKINSKTPLLFAIQIATEGELKFAELSNIIFFSLFAFSFASLFVYNLRLYASTKEGLFLVYAFYISTLFLLIIFTNGYFNLFLELNIFLRDIINSLSLLATYIVFIVFSIHFLEIQNISVKVYKYSIFLAGGVLLLYLVLLFKMNEFILNIFFLLFITLFCMSLGLIASLHKKKFAKLYLLGIAVLFLSIIISIMMMYALLDYNRFTSAALLIGSTFEMILLSLALEYKIQQSQKEKTISLIQNEAQDKMLFLQSRYASMGEVVGNIAHQWKQPLNAIGSIQSSIKAALIFKGEISKDKLLESVETSFKLVQHLAETIDTFYSFLSQRNSKYSNFNIVDEFESIRKITEYSFQNNNIKLLLEFQINPTIQGNANEFTHAILNLILNAKYALDNSKPENPTISIKVIGEENNCTITVSDNAGGISIKPIESIFKWHVSSKEESSGVGLYMTKNIIEKRFEGTIQVQNKEYGACFTIKLPYLKQEENVTNITQSNEKSTLEQIQHLSKKVIELEQLKKTLNKWAEIFKYAQWGIVVETVKENKIELINPIFAEMHGYSIDELIGKKLTSVIAPDHYNDLHLAMQNMQESEYYSFDSIHIRKDNSRFPVKVELMTVKDKNGDAIYKMVHIWDTTEKKEAQEKLKIKRFALEHMHEAVFMGNKHGDFTYVNHEACRALGYSREELLRMNIKDIVLHKQEKKLLIWDTLKEKKNVLSKVTYTRKDGTTFPVEMSSNYFEYDGVEYSICLVRDITERIRLEEQKLAYEILAYKEHTFHSLANNIPDNIARWDTEGRILYINPQHERTLGVSASELIGTYIQDDYLNLKKVIAQIASTGQAMFIREQIKTLNGNIEIHDISFVPEFNDDGEIISILGIGRNMTEVYKLQEQLGTKNKTSIL